MDGLQLCSNLQQGILCHCRTCMPSMVQSGFPLGYGEPQAHHGVPSPEMVQGLHKHVSTALHPHHRVDTLRHFNADEGYMGNQLLHQPVLGLSTPGVYPVDGFLPNNALQGEAHNTSPSSLSSVLEYSPTQENGEQHATTSVIGSEAGGRQSQASQRRVMRKTKYSEEPPRSIYGPPFQMMEIISGMDPEERERAIGHNAAVSEARKKFLRHKNNLAAKKSRDRKQALIEDLTTETKNLKDQVRRLQATNAELNLTAVRVNELKDENDNLRQDNDSLRSQVDDLEIRLHDLSIERQRDADRLNALMGLPGHAQAQKHSLGAMEVVNNPISVPQQRHHEGQSADGQISVTSAEMDHSFLDDLAEAGVEFNWESFQ
ncbi:hypothetical protein GGS20DRAFT_590312 [Poronia punctata]|nr:hypothetical protein GGS20DRAFT_590312 [Poronia punctata]